jgi:hypothetical protein
MQPLYRLRCLASFAGAAFDRARSAGNVAGNVGNGASKDGFTASGASAIASDFSVRAFVARCLEENTRRFAVYAPELLRPRVVPTMAGLFMKVTSLHRRGKPTAGMVGEA